MKRKWKSTEILKGRGKEHALRTYNAAHHHTHTQHITQRITRSNTCVTDVQHAHTQHSIRSTQHNAYSAHMKHSTTRISFSFLCIPLLSAIFPLYFILSPLLHSLSFPLFYLLSSLLLYPLPYPSSLLPLPLYSCLRSLSLCHSANIMF